jgi:hypothetical protein
MCVVESDLIFLGGVSGVVEGILHFYKDPVPYVCPHQHWQFVLFSPGQTNSPSISTVYFTHTCLNSFTPVHYFEGGGGWELGRSSEFIKIKQSWGLLVK